MVRFKSSIDRHLQPQASQVAIVLVIYIFLAGGVWVHIKSGEFVLAVTDATLLIFAVWFFTGFIIALITLQRAQVSVDAGEYAKADAIAHGAIKLLSILPCADRGSRFPVYCLLGNTSLLLGNSDQAEIAFRQSLQSLETMKTLSESPTAVICLNNLAWTLVTTGDVENGKVFANRAITVCEKNKLQTDSLQAFPLYTLALIDIGNEDWPRAEKKLQEAYSLITPLKPSNVVSKSDLEHLILSCEMNLSLVYLQLEKTEGGRELSQSLTNRLHEDASALTPWHIQTGVNLCKELKTKNELSLAEALLECLYSFARKHTDYPDNALLLDCYADLLENTNRASEIADLRN